MIPSQVFGDLRRVDNVGRLERADEVHRKGGEPDRDGVKDEILVMERF
jgi:hypothetical protein